jgi:hypothetical protein
MSSVSSNYLWLALFFLGCYHGVNPAMGWLFAVALGLQERRAAAVLAALPPLVLGHVVSVALVVAVAAVAAIAFPHAIVKAVSAAVLFSFGGYRLLRARHPRWVGMRVGFWGLAAWGFLMSSAHGAGLMLVPFVTARPPMPGSMLMPMPPSPVHAAYAWGALVVAVHTLGYAAAMAAVALLVYLKFGVSFLRTAWFNLDAVWAAALFATGIIALLT